MTDRPLEPWEHSLLRMPIINNAPWEMNISLFRVLFSCFKCMCLAFTQSISTAHDIHPPIVLVEVEMLNHA